MKYDLISERGLSYLVIVPRCSRCELITKYSDTLPEMHVFAATSLAIAVCAFVHSVAATSERIPTPGQKPVEDRVVVPSQERLHSQDNSTKQEEDFEPIPIVPRFVIVVVRYIFNVSKVGSSPEGQDASRQIGSYDPAAGVPGYPNMSPNDTKALAQKMLPLKGQELSRLVAVADRKDEDKSKAKRLDTNLLFLIEVK